MSSSNCIDDIQQQIDDELCADALASPNLPTIPDIVRFILENTYDQPPSDSNIRSISERLLHNWPDIAVINKKQTQTQQAIQSMHRLVEIAGINYSQAADRSKQHDNLSIEKDSITKSYRRYRNK